MKDVQAKLHIDENVQPVAQKHRRIPLPLRGKVEQELERLEKEGIIEKVYGPTDWVSPIVVQPKKNGDEVRICIDMREPNKAICCTRHVIPTLEELRRQMNGANKFSKLDLRNGYYQKELLIAHKFRIHHCFRFQ